MKNPGKIIDIIGVPSDFGANLLGALMGPAALRTAGIHQRLRSIGRDTADRGDIIVPVRYNLSEETAEKKYLKVITVVCQELKNKVLEAYSSNHLPLILGGDHSISIGSISATCEFFKGKKMGLLWIDTHPDINTPESSPTGNIHGMPVSVLLGKGYKELLELFNNNTTILPENIVMLGLKDIDPEERLILKDSGITYYTIRDVDEKGIQKIVKEVCKQNFKDIEGLHVSFDLDVMSPVQIPGVSTPVPGGLTLREAHLLLEMIFETQNIVAADFVELNPFKDIQGQSAFIGADLVCSLFGKTII